MRSSRRLQQQEASVKCFTPEQVAFKYAVLVYKCLHGSAPAYFTDELCQVADVEARWRLRSSSSSSLIVSRIRLSTVGDRAFPVAAARV